MRTLSISGVGSVVASLFLCGHLVAQSVDSLVTRKAADSTVALPVAGPPVTFPDLNERLAILGYGLVLVGGLGVLLNQKRKHADKSPDLK